MKRTIRSYVKRGGRLHTNKHQYLNAHVYPFYLKDISDLSHFSMPNVSKKKFFCDIGFGNGDALFDLASKNIDSIIIGIEVYDSGISTAIKKIVDEKITNVYIIENDAMEVLQKWSGPKFSCIRLLFPDPWPKKRHHKRRLLQSDFIMCAYDHLIDNGVVHFASDWNPYSEEVKKTFLEKKFLYSKKLSKKMRAERIPTKFELRGLLQDRKSVDMVFTKKIHT